MGDPNRNTPADLASTVYFHLHAIAERQMRGERPGNTLSATALVHEAYLRLVGDEDPPWQNRAHFFAAAAEAMRRILIERARRRSRRDRCSMASASARRPVTARP